MRVWTKTHKLLRKIAAETNEQLVEVLHPLAQAEWQRIQEQCQDHTKEITVVGVLLGTEKFRYGRFSLLPYTTLH